MQDLQLFQLALGLTPPWQVVESRFEAAQQRLDLHLDFPCGSRFACPDCGQGGCGVHDTEEKTWRPLNFFQHEADLPARVPRLRCPQCGVRRVTVPWARPGSGFTLLFEALVLQLITQMPVNAVARRVGETDTRLWRVVHPYVDMSIRRGPRWT